MSLMPTNEQRINTLEMEIQSLRLECEMYKIILEKLNKTRTWKFVVKEDGVFYCQPQFDLKVGDSAWPFNNGEYVTLREVITNKGNENGT